MIITLDIGNTNMEFGIFKNQTLTDRFRLITNQKETSDEIGLMVTQFFQHRGMKKSDVEEVVVSSVVPQVLFSVTNAFIKYFDKKPLFIGQGLPVPLYIHGVNSSEVGADRLVDAYGAYCKYKGPLIVIDFGTATTFDVVTAQGEFYGGPTCPGVKTSMDALYQNAAMLPMIELEAPSSVMAKDTVTSMQAGAVFSFVGAAEYIIKRIREEWKEDLPAVATGGFSSLIKEQTQQIQLLDKTLTLDGIFSVYRHHRL